MSAHGYPEWVDSHCHLDFPAFAADREAVIARARAAGVTDVVVPGTTPEAWAGVASVASEPGVHAAYGLHPWWVDEYRPQHLEMLKERIASDQAVAIGECGLDFARDDDRDLQHQWFMAQLRLASEFGLPLIVHAVRALDVVLAELNAFPGVSGVIHGFSGSLQQAERCMAAGFMLGIGTSIARSGRLRDVVRDLPLEHLLLETDAPDRSLSGARGEPADVVAIAEAVCALKGLRPEQLAEMTTDNATRLFQWGNRQ